MNEFPRVIIISNNSISKSSNTGRTLANLFTGWPKDRLAQFCISTTEPDYDVCENYYLLTDRSVFDGFKHFRKGKRCDIDANKGTEGNTVVGGNVVKKTPLKMLLRQIVWCGKRWRSEEFVKWIDSFNPEIVFLWNSDCIFILDIARTISERKRIPIVMYNTEGYYCYEKNIYKTDKLFGSLFYPIFHSLYKRHFRKMMKRVCLSIHLNSMLRDDYHRVFGGKDMVLYTGSNLKFDSSNLHLEAPIFSYLGNLAFDRHSALIEIAEVLQSINKTYILDVYGQAPSKKVETELKDCSGIEFHGMVPYNDVIKVIYNSTILFHAETHNKKMLYFLRYGFSTKIADSIASGHPFLMYSPIDIAGAKYVVETGAAWYAKDKVKLKNEIVSILSKDDERHRVLDIAKQIALNNHDAKMNSLIIQKQLREVSIENTTIKY